MYNFSYGLFNVFFYRKLERMQAIRKTQKGLPFTTTHVTFAITRPYFHKLEKFFSHTLYDGVLACWTFRCFTLVDLPKG